MTIEEVLSRFSAVKKVGNGWSARCPAHEDGQASLSISNGDNGGILLHCHAGCTIEAVVGKVGLTVKDLFSSDGDHKNTVRAEIVACYDYRDERGELLYQVARYVPKDFRQRTPKPGGGWSWSAKGVRRVPYRLPELLAADPALIVFVVEGEKDADNLAKRGAVATTNVGGAGKWPADFGKFLAGRRVVIVPDNDKAGRDHAQHVARSCHGRAASIRIVELPELAPKGDVSDWLAVGGTVEELLKLVEAVAEWQPDQGDTKPIIVVDIDEERVNREAIAALAQRDDVFQRGGALVHVVRDADPPKNVIRPKGAPRIVFLPPPILREKLAASAIWQKYNRKGEVENCHPPDWVVRAIDTRGSWSGIRRLEAVVEAPVLLADGSVLQETGYNEGTGILFLPRAEFPRVADQPSHEDAEWARDQLLEVFQDFPFASDVDRATCLAAVLTPPARHSFSGPSPLFTIESNTPGTGKGLEVSTSSIISTGREVSRTCAPRDNEEMRKVITSIAIAGEPVVLFDNVSGAFGYAALDAALTGTSWSDRVLATNKIVSDLPLFTIWFATGNNIVYGADTARRVCPCRMESPLENPEEREGFHHCDLLAWVRQEYPRLAVLPVVILRAYHVAGRPKMKLKSWGSFEGWSAAVREPIVWVGLPDPASGRQELRARADDQASFLRRLLDGWTEIDPFARGLTISKALKILDDDPDCYQTLRAVLTEIPSRRDKLNLRSIGMKFHHLRRRVSDGRFLDSTEVDHQAVWLVRHVEQAGTKGTTGTNSPSPTRETSLERAEIL